MYTLSFTNPQDEKSKGVRSGSQECMVQVPNHIPAILGPHLVATPHCLHPTTEQGSAPANQRIRNM